MTVTELREALDRMPGHVPVHIEIVESRHQARDETSFHFTSECVIENFPSQGRMAVIRINYEPK